jgi:predicted PurR-regulated permease PerM
MSLANIINAKTLIWAGFLGLAYVLRHFFLIIFMTFLISYLMRNLILFLSRKIFRSNSNVIYKFLTITCFLLLLSVIYFGSKFTAPRLTQQGQALLRKLGSIEDSPQRAMDSLLRITVGSWLFEQTYTDGDPQTYNAAFNEFASNGILLKEYNELSRIIDKAQSAFERTTNRKLDTSNVNLNSIKNLKVTDTIEYNSLIKPFIEEQLSTKKLPIKINANQLLALFNGHDNPEKFTELFRQNFLTTLPESEKTDLLRQSFKYTESIRLVESWKQGTAAEELSKAAQAKLITIIGKIGNYLASLIPIILTLPVQLTLSLMLSFFITFDIRRLSEGALKIKSSHRVGHIYDEIVPGLVRFASLIGRAFQAQGVIALTNTVLTYALMQFLQIENSLFLSLIVFLGSFIPVLGVVLSGAPICAVAIVQDGGSLMLALWVIIGILVVHFIETSILNPKIVGTFLHLHPVLVLVILAIGEHFFGAWGLLLGLPIAVYIFRIVILDEGLPWEKKST